MASRETKQSKRLIVDLRDKFREQAKNSEPLEQIMAKRLAKANGRWMIVRFAPLLSFAIFLSLTQLHINGYTAPLIFVGVGSMIGLGWVHRKSFVERKIADGANESDALETYRDKYND
jgi:hypothetical protein